MQLSPERNHPRDAATLLDNLALIEKALGHHDEALRLSMRALQHYRSLADVAREAMLEQPGCVAP